MSKAASILGVSLLIAAGLVCEGLHSVAREIHDKPSMSFPNPITVKGGDWPLAVKLTSPEGTERPFSVRLMSNGTDPGEAFNVKVLPAPPATK